MFKALIVFVLQLVIAEILNIIGAALSITAVVQLSVELTVMKSSNYYEDCYPPFAYGHFRTISHEEENNIDACIHYKNFSKVIVLFVLCGVMCVH